MSTLTRRQRLQLSLYVAQGADLLDHIAPPTWPAIIAARVPDMSMSDGTNCIVGTLLKAGFLNGIEHALGQLVDYGDWVEKNGLQDGLLGFNLPKNFWETYENDPQNSDKGFTETSWEGVKTAAMWSALLEVWASEVHGRVTPAMIEKAQAHMAVRRSELGIDIQTAQKAVEDIEVFKGQYKNRIDRLRAAYDEAQAEAARRGDELEEAEAEAEEENYDENALDDAEAAYRRTVNREAEVKDIQQGLEDLRVKLLTLKVMESDFQRP